MDTQNYKAITVANSPNNPPFNLNIFDVNYNIPCPEYILPTHTTSEVAFLATVNDVANTDGVYLVDYVEFPTYDAPLSLDCLTQIIRSFEIIVL